MTRLAVVLAALLAFVGHPAAAQGTNATRRAGELIAILNGKGAPTATFSRAFLADVPEAKLREVAASVRAQLGAATGIAAITPLDAQRAELRIAYERGTAHAVMVLAPGASAKVSGFWIDNVEPADIRALRTLDDVGGALAALPGSTGFAVADVDRGGALQASLAPDRPLAVASTFKLVILAELVRAINAGERRWTDTVRRGSREMPAGAFERRPPGTNLTLRELAEAMIGTSDNSATDMLLYALGRERVERMQAEIGFRHADANQPFLATLEAFKLKRIDGGALGRRYLAADTAERRRLLDEDVAHQPASAIAPADGRPVMIEGIEWFASPLDVVRALGWFAGHAETPAGAEALRILARNPGPAASVRRHFGYVGYKGGSEPGVVSMSLLVRDHSERWSVVTATWNDPASAVDETRFQALVTRALAILAP